MSFFAELKRRNVIRVALAYAVVAWFIVQAADVLLGNFGAPSWVFKTVTSLLALGLPLVLFLSWVYDLTPDGIQKTDAADVAGVPAPDIGRGVRAALMAGLVLMAGAAAWLTLRSDDPASKAQQAAVGATAPTEMSQAARSTLDKPLTSAATRGTRFIIAMPEGMELSQSIAISRDGAQIAFAGMDADGETHVYLRRLNEFEPKRVEGSRDGFRPFFSFDGSSVGFYARGAIWRAATAGGPPTQLRAAKFLTGADWMEDDTIVYSTGEGSALQHMTAEGAPLEPLTRLGKNQIAHAWPQRIPGTDQVLFSIWGGGVASKSSAVGQVLDLKTRSVRPLSGSPEVDNPPARWSASGHLILETFGNDLFATRFDPASKQSAPLAGASALLGGVYNLNGARSVFALSDSGTMAYVPSVQSDRRLVRIGAEFEHRYCPFT